MSADLKNALKTLGWSASVAAPVFGVQRKTLSAWSAGRVTPTASRAAHVEALTRGMEAVGALEDTKAWLKAHGCVQRPDSWGYVSSWSPWLPPVDDPASCAILAAHLILAPSAAEKGETARVPPEEPRVVSPSSPEGVAQSASALLYPGDRLQARHAVSAERTPTAVGVETPVDALAPSTTPVVAGFWRCGDATLFHPFADADDLCSPGVWWDSEKDDGSVVTLTERDAFTWCPVAKDPAAGVWGPSSGDARQGWRCSPARTRSVLPLALSMALKGHAGMEGPPEGQDVCRVCGGLGEAPDGATCPRCGGCGEETWTFGGRDEDGRANREEISRDLRGEGAAPQLPNKGGVERPVGGAAGSQQGADGGCGGGAASSVRHRAGADARRALTWTLVPRYGGDTDPRPNRPYGGVCRW